MDKRELQQYQWILCRIEAYERERERIIAGMYRVGIKPEGPSRSKGKRDPVASAATRLADLDSLLRQRQAELMERRFAIERVIGGLPDNEAFLLQLRYIEGRSWDEIAGAMHYSLRSVYGLHDRALRNIAAFCS